MSSAPSAAPSNKNCTPTTPTLSVALALTVTVALTVAPFAGAVIATVGGVVSVFDTVTTTAADVAVFPAASRARAVNVCEPLLVVVVFHATAYGAVVSSAPSAPPSSRNCTPATPTLSEALAVTVTVRLTVAPDLGWEDRAVTGIDRVTDRLADEVGADREAVQVITLEHLLQAAAVVRLREGPVDLEMVAPAGELEPVEAPLAGFCGEVLERQVGPLAGEQRDWTAHDRTDAHGSSPETSSSP